MKLPVVAGQLAPRDGRNLDPLLGILGGDGGLQRVDPRALAAAHPAPGRLAAIPSRTVAETATYYGQAALKEPVWRWYIPAYFAVGGLAGATAALGAAVELRGAGSRGGLVTRCRFLAAAGCAASGGLLILDLGRPVRFLYMLRVFRPTSPMNLGTWILSAAGATSGLAAGLSLLPGRRARRAASAAGLVAGAAGLPLATYTAALVSNTAVPIWSGTRRTLPWLFAAGAAASAAGALELLGGRGREERVVRRLAAIAESAELAAAVAVEFEARRQPGVARPLSRGTAGLLWRGAAVATAASAWLAGGAARSRARRRVGALLGLAGTLAMRFAVLAAGRASARDPLATFVPQREALASRGAAPSPPTTTPEAATAAS